MNITIDQCHGQVALTFDAKPDADTRQTLKNNGFRWNPGARCWYRRKVGNVYDLVAYLEKKNNPPETWPCWKCKAPGTMRQYGAATPVYCDTCHAEHEQHRLSQYTT